MIEDLIRERRVLICAGSGGVGKTTTAAALGVAAARLGRRCLVLTIDPARRLASALGLESQGGQIVRVPLSGVKGELSARMVEPKQVFLDFLARTSPSPEASQAILSNRLFQEMISTLSGSQEFTSLEALLSATEATDYDLVILDTPPAQNAVDFLRAPERIFELFQESVTRWFAQPPTNSLVAKLMRQGSSIVIQALEKITGSAFLRELSDFFTQAASFQENVAARSIQAHQLLSSPSTTFILVTVMDGAKLREARDFSLDLKSSGHHLGAVILNRARPGWVFQGADRQVRTLGSGYEGLQKLIKVWYAASDYHHRKREHFRKLLSEDHRGLRFHEVPDFILPVTGVEGLEQMAIALTSASAAEEF